ncbi:hypothetical protein KM043_011343 [Ampulex compressa]|nr:hypothetical protein KM043_011343 [Ampulex compressa]
MSSASTGGTEGSSPASSPASATSLTMAAPKYGTLVPNRIFVGGISANTSEEELAQLFSTYGNVKATKIIADRAGVSKGYGFVTFETEEEAKRLQQESESIVLRERRLNIAPAIKKQSFNRPFDGGSGSPPSVPNNAYYYPNGMGLAYQNGIFYNTAAAAPATPIAPPTDPATIYQATGMFGPQAATGHQTFAPVMYQCPAPSLYMPQQYPYSPVPYEPYYPGAPAAGTSPYLYTAGGSQSNTSGSGSNSGNGNNATGATSPPSGPPPSIQSLPPPPPGHFYAPTAPPPHHHASVPTGPSPPQVDHLYYPFTAGPHPPPPPHATMGLNDQQLLLYTVDASCQQTSASDTQAASQEDSRSTSTHSEQPHGETQAASGSATPLVSLMPVKFPMSTRYTNYHPIAIHTANLHSSQACLNETEECTSNQMHCRTIVYHPATVYIPHAHTPAYQNTSGGGSLLPTPPSVTQQIYETNNKGQNLNSRDYSKSVLTSTQTGYIKSQNHGISLTHHNTFGKAQTVGNQSYKYGSVDGKYSTITMTSPRLPLAQYNRRTSGTIMGSPATCFVTQKSGGYGPSIQSNQKSGNFAPVLSYSNQTYNHTSPNSQKGPNLSNVSQDFEYTNGRRNQNSNAEHYLEGFKVNNYGSVRKNVSNNYRNSSTIVSTSHYDVGNGGQAGENYDTNQVENGNLSGQILHCTEVINSDKPASPPPAPYSPMTRPLPILSPPTPQVQFYGPTQNRYQPGLTSQHQQQQQQQQQSTQRRYTVAQTLSAARKPPEKYTGAQATTMLRQGKYKVNGIMQMGSSKVTDEGLGGAGDAPPTVRRMPITPPGSPRTHPGLPAVEQNQLSDTCHQMQALNL